MNTLFSNINPNVILFSISLIIVGITIGVSYSKLDKRISVLEERIQSLIKLFNAD